MKKIAIVGAGAAGMIAAARILELLKETDGEEAELFLIERNKVLGKKVSISGGGRCNVTTGYEDLKFVMRQYPRGSKFLRTAMYAFSPKAMWDFMEGLNVPLKKEADFRVFPKSNNGQHVVRAFERLFEEGGVNVMYENSVKEMRRVEQESLDEEEPSYEIALSSGEFLTVDALILSVGGQAYRHTGSSGDGYSFAESLGHSVTALGPSLSALVLREPFTAEISGLSFEDVAFTFRGNGVYEKGSKYKFRGPFIFTHRGVSGPAVFALSALAAFEQFQKNNAAELLIDFFPDENMEELRTKLSGHLKASPKKAFLNVLSALVPRSFAERLLVHLGIDSKKQSAELSKKDLSRTLNALKNLSFDVIGRVPGDEFVTAGGVSTKEVDAKTMQSKISPGLYFAGEILDYDGFTGGFNLQAAWATGRLAGESAFKALFCTD